jgi:hypothetical protein
MLKFLFTLLLVFGGFVMAFAQQIDPKKDTVIYYFKNYEIPVATLDSADYGRITIPPVNGSKLYTIKEYYKNGTLKLETTSTSYKLFPYVEGEYTEYYPNGKKRSTMKFHNGFLDSEIYEYYPNGNIYTIRSPDRRYGYSLKECRDSIGKILAQNGEGQWIEYYNDFKQVYMHGPIKDGARHGDWYTKDNDISRFVVNFNYNTVAFKDRNVRVQLSVDMSGLPHRVNYNKYIPAGGKATLIYPQYPQGMEPFYTRIHTIIEQPDFARKNKIPCSTVVAFFVKEDGTMDDFKILKASGFGWEDEVITLIKKSGPWKPATINGINVGAYTMVSVFRPDLK